ncbi:hypothetical protein [Latilactobacillus sakei]|uniref:hypothetical protein n=1 Tax=Latilactobacillus sakei TaxID=1599 RepID=UPI0007053E24|nr:hypothetical protein [Latilactobacillus sakei]MCP8855201.1 hypothetical protein [Latilactobacillus sakei]GEP21148.1 hypothetical protein LSA03nite_07360 [Latilactobacillus sakei subsp. carnosus]
MLEQLPILRNELKNSTVPTYKLIGISSELILSKEIFSKNSDIPSFLLKTFDVEYKEYVIGSRTTIVARLSRLIHNATDSEIRVYKSNLFKFIQKVISDNE